MLAHVFMLITTIDAYVFYTKPSGITFACLVLMCLVTIHSTIKE